MLKGSKRRSLFIFGLPEIETAFVLIHVVYNFRQDFYLNILWIFLPKTIYRPFENIIGF